MLPQTRDRNSHLAEETERPVVSHVCDWGVEYAHSQCFGEVLDILDPDPEDPLAPSRLRTADLVGEVQAVRAELLLDPERRPGVRQRLADCRRPRHRYTVEAPSRRWASNF